MTQIDGFCWVTRSIFNILTLQEYFELKLNLGFVPAHPRDIRLQHLLLICLLKWRAYVLK